MLGLGMQTVLYELENVMYKDFTTTRHRCKNTYQTQYIMHIVD